MTDPEQTAVQLHPADLQEVEADEADEFERPTPLEAEAADVLEQKHAVDEGLDDYREADYEF